MLLFRRSRRSAAWRAGAGSLLAALLWVQGVGCARLGPERPPERTGPPVSPGALYDALQARGDRVSSLEAVGRFRIHTGERRARLDVTLLCRRPDSVRFEASDFLDHFVFLAILRDGQLASYSAHENLYAGGPASAARMGALLGVPVGPEALVSLLLGSPFFVPVRDPSLQVTAAGEHDLLVARDAGGALCTTVRVDRGGRPVESRVEGSLAPGLSPASIRVDFSRYRSVDGMEFPFRIRVTDERGDRFFQLDFREIALNRPLAPDLFVFDPPPDAERLTW